MAIQIMLFVMLVHAYEPRQETGQLNVADRIAVRNDLSTLPKHVPAPEGQVSLFVDWNGNDTGMIRVFVVNRDSRPFKLNTRGSRIYLLEPEVDFGEDQGGWNRLTSHRPELCGVGLGTLVLRTNEYCFQDLFSTDGSPSSVFSRGTGDPVPVCFRLFGTRFRLVSNETRWALSRDYKPSEESKNDRLSTELLDLEQLNAWVKNGEEFPYMDGVGAVLDAFGKEWHPPHAAMALLREHMQSTESQVGNRANEVYANIGCREFSPQQLEDLALGRDPVQLNWDEIRRRHVALTIIYGLVDPELGRDFSAEVLAKLASHPDPVVAHASDQYLKRMQERDAQPLR